MNCTVARSLFAVLLLLLSAATARPQSPTPPPEQGIPLPEIITRAEQVKRPLHEIAARVSSNAEVAAIADRLNAGEAQLPAQARQVEERIATAPTLYELRELEREWRQRGVELDSWQKTLAQAGAQAETDLRRLRDEQLRWTQTLNSIDDPDLLETVFERIRAVLADTQRLQAGAEERLNLMLSLQDRASQQDLLAASVTDQIARAKQRFQGQLLARDNRPLWSALLRRQAAATGAPSGRASESFLHEMAAARESLKSQAENIALLVLLFGIVLWSNIKLARKIDPLPANDETLHQPAMAARVLKRPISVALLITLLTYLWLSPQSASVVNSIAALLLLIPFLRVARLLVEPPAWLRVPFYVLAVLHLSDQIRFLADIEAVIERMIFLAEIAVAFGAIVWMLRPERFDQLSNSAFTLKWLRRALYGTLALLGVSLLANVFGFVTLAKVLGEGVLHSAYLGALLYAAARIAIIVIAMMLRTRRIQTLAFVRLYRDEIVLWCGRAAYLAAAVVWLNGALELFTIREQALAAGSRVLDASLGFRSLAISIGDVLSFLLVVVTAYYAARIIRIILQEDVLTRIPLKRGVPQAIATAVQYLLLIIGFVMALTAAGFELNRLTLLTGAFGVGIGFGLQNIINNFVSGLILLFERPVQVGDAVQVGVTSGDITRIGIRSSTISTAQGAEVIVPNAKLISDEVTNWTLSNQIRRAEISVGVDYNSDPTQVIKLLVAVAKSNPDVLTEPTPFALFKGFGENALEFELRFWVAFQSHVTVKSQVAVAVAVALREAGINIPTPQRDLHVTLTDGELKNVSPPDAPPQ
ncbi:MAG: mechanosensitive ion channel domain-containing protein [Acidobacteriota bacterium]